jgi:signal peptidase I
MIISGKRPVIFGKVSQKRNLAGVVLLIVVLWFLYMVETRKVVYYEIMSSSMEPTLKPGDRKIMTQPENYQQGDIVVLTRPEGGSEIVKRLVAMEADHVRLKDGLLYINGKLQDDPQGRPPSIKGLKDQDFFVPRGHVYVVGDNLSSSFDSRDFGPVPYDHLRGVLD